MKTYRDIVSAAEALYQKRDQYCYFYGAKNVRLTDDVMESLWRAEPGYFSRYGSEQKKAIFNFSRGRIGLDCSAFVCLVLETAGIITRGQWTYSTALIGKCTNVTADVASASSPAGSLLYSTFHNAGRHIGVDGSDGWFYDIAAEGDTIRHLRIRDYGKWEKAGRYPGVDYSGAFSAPATPTRFAVPEGFLDSATPTAISGWAYDGTDSSLTVHIYVFRGTQQVDLFATTANIYRADLLAAGKGNGKHGFSVPYDFAAKHGAGTYTVRAYAINQAGGTNPMLSTEKTLTVAQSVSWTGKAQTAVYMRTDANPGAQAVTVLNQGVIVTVMGSKKSPDGGTWYHVRTADGKTGYTNAKYIVKV